MIMKKKTKIICTIGPASNEKSVLKEMIDAGMDVARINCSHGNHEFYSDVIGKVRSLNNDVAIIIDLQGPEIRLNCENTCAFIMGKKFTFSCGRNGKSPWVDFPLYKYVKKNDKILLGDGELELKIVKVSNKKIECTTLNEAQLDGRKGLHVVGKNIPMDFLSKKDISDLQFAIKNKADFVAASFVHNVQNVKAVKKILGKSGIKIISKIESRSAVKNIDKIIAESHAIMVARGDLGLELPAEEVPLLQKKIIKKCNILGTPVVVATQMLESMVSKPRPTRAETSDVANAILDGCDAIMLSGETAIGKYPVKAVREMTKIAKKVEPEVKMPEVTEKYGSVSNAISHAVNRISKVMKVDKILTATMSGYTARKIARHRPTAPIIAITKSDIVRRQLALVRGVVPVSFHLTEVMPSEKLSDTINLCLRKKLIGLDDTIAITGGIANMGKPNTNFIRIHKVSDLVKYYKNKK
ncbi:MAG: pyruvate kinase [Candidatus Diapherotrites archaeon]